MSMTKNELRQSRVELMAAKEEVRIARVEVTDLRRQLAESKVMEKRQSVEIEVSARWPLHRAIITCSSSSPLLPLRAASLHAVARPDLRFVLWGLLVPAICLPVFVYGHVLLDSQTGQAVSSS